jgi:integrase
VPSAVRIRHRAIEIRLFQEKTTSFAMRQILTALGGLSRLFAELLHGTGLRITECLTMRVKDIDFGAGTIHIRSGKGGKDRTAILPSRLRTALQEQLIMVARIHKHNLTSGAGHAPLPGGLDRKYPNVSRILGWQFVFPSRITRKCPGSGRTLRWYASESTLQKHFKDALSSANTDARIILASTAYIWESYLQQ